jgi:bifunctional UDP-N-acetylglucosamine pyrophosphorylase/glucosamine-1-phosphate N-acetyltransferase
MDPMSTATQTPAVDSLAIVLAAGEGTRMKSALPKVLHGVAGRSLVGHVLASVAAAGIGRSAVVVGPDCDDVRAEVLKRLPDAAVFEQRERRGTAHAVLAARKALDPAPGAVIVLFGDTPLVTPETIARLRDAVSSGNAVTVLGFQAADPTGYGRLVMRDGELVAIREHKDASKAERALTLCNGGLMALDGRHALELLDAVRADNAQQEFYLTDVVALARARGLAVGVEVTDESEVMGVNDRVQLAAAEAALQGRLRRTAMLAGTTLVAPETVFLSADTALAPDVVVEPHVVFGPGVTVRRGAVIHAFSHLEGATVGEGASIGPFARLRPGADLAEGAKVGNFVELKNATLGRGAKVNHLSYVGDASVGAAANIGAGTITCNYDGYGKYRTTIGEGAFVGSNASLVAPVTIGAGGYVGSGSVVTRDVPADALAVARARQETKEGWAATFRARKATAKKPG